MERIMMVVESVQTEGNYSSPRSAAAHMKYSKNPDYKIPWFLRTCWANVHLGK